MRAITTKYFLFLLAYLPIYFIVALKNINSNIFDVFGHPLPFREICKINIIPCLLMLFSAVLILFFLFHQWRSLRARGNSIFTIKQISHHNKEYITYLGTYILPFIALETKSIFDVLAYVFMFLTIGMIYAKTNLIYTNPVLMMFQYDIYEVTTTTDNTYVCISKDKHEKGESPIGVRVGDKTYLISKWKKQA